VRSVGATAIPANFITGSVSGILGLALQGTAIPGTPFFRNLFPNSVMSFQLNRFTGTVGAQEEEANGGVFTLGGSNATLYTGPINFVAVVEPASGPTYWMIHLSCMFALHLISSTSKLTPVPAITVQGKSVPVTAGASALATFNTASGLIGGPTTDVSAIWAAVPGAIRSTTDAGFYEFREQRFHSCLGMPGFILVSL
jgi:cathepsin D